jgi:hypothetical protein
MEISLLQHFQSVSDLYWEDACLSLTGTLLHWARSLLVFFFFSICLQTTQRYVLSVTDSDCRKLPIAWRVERWTFRKLWALHSQHKIYYRTLHLLPITPHILKVSSVRTSNYIQTLPSPHFHSCIHTCIKIKTTITTNITAVTNSKLAQAILVLPFTCGQVGSSFCTETDYPDWFTYFFFNFRGNIGEVLWVRKRPSHTTQSSIFYFHLF